MPLSPLIPSACRFGFGSLGGHARSPHLFLTRGLLPTVPGLSRTTRRRRPGSGPLVWDNAAVESGGTHGGTLTGEQCSPRLGSAHAPMCSSALVEGLGKPLWVRAIANVARLAGERLTDGGQQRSSGDWV